MPKPERRGGCRRETARATPADLQPPRRRDARDEVAGSAGGPKAGRISFSVVCRRSRYTSIMNDRAPVAFVMMPFSTEFNAVYDGLIAPALDGYEVIRADTRFDQRSILEKIVTGIAEASLVVADITALNPNVMYELGIAHTLGKPVIMITQNIEELPFDVSAYPVHEYSTHFQRAADLSQKLRELSTRHRQGLLRFASPVTDFLQRPLPSTAPSGREPESKPAEPEREPTDEADGEIKELQPTAPSGYGYLDFAADLEDHGGTALQQMQRLNELTTSLNAKLHELAPQINEARRSSSGGSASRARRLTNYLAGHFEEYARTIETGVIPSFHASWEQIGQSLLWLLQHSDADDASTDDLRELAEHVTALHQVLTSNIESMSEVRALFPMMRGQTRELTRAADEAERALARLMGEYTLATSYLGKIEEHLTSRMASPASGLT